MCACFGPAFSYMIRNEDSQVSGVVTSEPGGGQARLGINSTANPQAVSDGFYTMSLTDALAYAENVYQTQYWNGRGLDGITSQQVASKLFDVGVNMGNAGVVAVLHSTQGVNSSNVVSSINAMEPTQFLGNFVMALKTHYQAIVNSNPAKYQKYLNAWLSRATKLPPADVPVEQPEEELTREA